MNIYLKIVLIITGLAYLASPVDLIPEFLIPIVGWLDDGAVLGTIYYLIRYGKLPNYFLNRINPFNQMFHKRNAGFTSKKARRTEENSTDDFHNRHRKRSPGRTQSPCEILGVAPDADREEIKKAYKQAIKKYHPDKVSHLGKDFSDLANEKFLEIQKAYEFMMKTYDV